MSFTDKWNDYRPSKTALFWTAAGAVVVTLIVGFSWGGWVTGGTATDMAEEAAENAQAQLAATICFERFVNANNVEAELAALKETSSWKREDFITEGGWVELPGVKEPVDEAAEICAERLADFELSVQAEKSDTAVQ